MIERTMRNVRCAVSMIALVLGQSQRADADTCQLTASKDNTIFQDLTTRSFGAGDFLFAGRAATGSRRALVAFNLTACTTPIPAGSTVTAATLTLRADRRGPSFSNETVRLFRLTQNWGEAGSDTNSSGGIGSGSGGGDGIGAQPQDATWQARFFAANPAMSWTTAGGDFAAQESASTMLTNFTNGTPTQFNWSSPQMISDVQGWLTAPAGNFGWIVRANEATPRTAVRFISRNHPQQANWPTLRIDYTPPATRLPGDVDNDSDVDLADFKLMTANLGRTAVPASDQFNQGDFSGDGRVGIRDLIILRNNLGRTSPSPELAAPVPEPATAFYVLLLAGAVLACRAARHRRLTP
jgi:hypothetical protein